MRTFSPFSNHAYRPSEQFHFELLCLGFSFDKKIVVRRGLRAQAKEESGQAVAAARLPLL
jgi:hypothetical protein